MYNWRKLQMNKDQDELSKTRSLRAYIVHVQYLLGLLYYILNNVFNVILNLRRLWRKELTKWLDNI